SLVDPDDPHLGNPRRREDLDPADTWPGDELIGPAAAREHYLDRTLPVRGKGVAEPETGRVRVERALLSVDDKSGLADFARGLTELGVELWATRGTRQALETAGVRARAAEDLTGIGSWFGGRIKTLHPALLAGILSPFTADGEKELTERGFLRFDLIVVELYPFEKHLAEHPTMIDHEEYIDIGGVTLARAAAKNHARVAVVLGPHQYGPVLEELRTSSGALSADSRRNLAAEAFRRVSAYDGAIARGISSAISKDDPFPSEVLFRRAPLRLRYGENPHQRSAVYTAISRGAGLTGEPFEQIKGDPLSFTNLLDLETALATVAEFPTPSATVVKHATPCGAASGNTIGEAVERAIATDPVARYGCAVAVNRPLGPSDLSGFKGVFVDILSAPEFDPAAKAQFDKRPKIKLVRMTPRTLGPIRWEAHNALDRLLLQEVDQRQLAPDEFRLVTGSPITGEEACSLDFAWRVVRHTKSNAIVLAQGSRTVGIGGGQPTRAKSVQLACDVAGDRAKGAVLASDAFFPFADGIEIAGKAGVRAIIQPGGSMRDPEVTAMAERYGISMLFTGWRVFRH
ncbi:MAG: bifunctional phosphoribosylaminoimidazolecarboxamide formyltransferase/IMP cyclohydrolase, partial [Thermoplasmata archaeon]